MVSDQIASRVLGYDGLRLALPNSFNLSGELLLASLLLGIASGVVAIYFGRMIRLSEFIFSKIKAPLFIKTTIGGLFIGGLSLYFPTSTNQLRTR